MPSIYATVFRTDNILLLLDSKIFFHIDFCLYKGDCMYGFGIPEAFAALTVLFFIYGIFMTIDAIRRPAEKYSTRSLSGLTV